MARTIPLLDLMFFLAETRESPKHVAGLLTFKLPDDAGKRYVADLVAAYRRATPVAPFNQVPEFSLTRMPRWVKARRIDMKYHVRRMALPEGATHAELLDLVADLHAELLDRDHPCFRVWFIEGLGDRTFAMYLKMHHAMIDGQSGMARLAASLATRQDAREVRPFFAIDFEHAAPQPSLAGSDAVALLKGMAFKQLLAAKDLYQTLLRKGIGTHADSPGSVPFTAVRTSTNKRPHAERSLATLTLPLDEMKAVGRAFGGTLNDVAVTIVDAGLTRYLAKRGELPPGPLVAMCPVSLREAGDKEATIKVSALFVRLGSASATIGKRMQQVMRATESAKGELRGMSKDAAMLYAILAFCFSEAVEAAGIDHLLPPLANFVVSNVPGSPHALYLAGARMLGSYPISTLGGGMGLNVTLVSYANEMDFGFVANGAAMPELDQLARYTRDAFGALKKAAARHAAATMREMEPHSGSARTRRGAATKTAPPQRRRNTRASRALA